MNDIFRLIDKGSSNKWNRRLGIALWTEFFWQKAAILLMLKWKHKNVKLFKITHMGDALNQSVKWHSCMMYSTWLYTNDIYWSLLLKKQRGGGHMVMPLTKYGQDMTLFGQWHYRDQQALFIMTEVHLHPWMTWVMIHLHHGEICTNLSFIHELLADGLHITQLKIVWISAWTSVFFFFWFIDCVCMHTI